ncbi:MAG TPA: hypothetical protein VII61_23935 [Ktedonobacteraceae bacterium]
MEAFKQPGHYFMIEPLRWLFRSFFQPARFQKDFAQIPLSRRMKMMLRLFLPMFLCTYPLSLLLRLGFFSLSPHLYHHYFSLSAGRLQFDMAFFLIDATWATILSCSAGSLFGSFFGVEYGVVFGLTDGIVNGIIIHMSNSLLIMLLCGVAAGLLLGLTFNSTGVIKRGGLKTTSLGIIYGILAGSVIGFITGIFCGFAAGSALLFLGERFSHLQSHNSGGVQGNIVGILAGVITGCFVMKLVGTIAKGNTTTHRDLVDVITRVGIAVAGALGATIGLLTGNFGLQGTRSVFDVIIIGGLPAFVAWVAFLVCYVPGYFRIPLYPISAFALLRASSGSVKNPNYVFHYLHRSSLYWDECVFLPLPHLKRMLLIAADQNKDEALSEIYFILQERSQQRSAAQAVALNIALNDLGWRETLRDICGAQQQLAGIVTQEIRQAHPPIASVIQRLEGASQDATNYYTHISWQGRSQALTNMLTNLQSISSRAVFKDPLLNLHLEKVVRKWLEVTRREIEALSLKRSSEGVGRIENPYMPGLVLEQRDPLFVGRAGLARQLGTALRSNHPPTFFLTGERRMGKSSILKHLAALLGSHYLPIFYDLQSTGITSSIAALLASVAEEVHETLLKRGMLVRKLEYEHLRDDLRENESVAYHHFSRWLKEVDRVLTQEDRVLLLTFDEFEKLAEAEQNGYLDLDLLFGWFRSVIQGQSHVVLLFSGVKSITEMGTRWAGYFVNVELLKVSFLEPEEVRQLIRQPVPDFPGEHIFGVEVTEEILRLTGGHPFLIQALCSALITHLNSCLRQQARLDDVAVAIDEIFEKWSDSYFKDLWERTEPEQQMCLRGVCASSGSCSADAIQHYCGLDEAMVASHLAKLLRRDLLRCDSGEYRIAAPIFGQWVVLQ